MKRWPRLLFIALILAALFRFTNISSNPPSLSHDEVAIGYNAYSILKTGRDEYSTPFPLLFRSFDDYKLPGMVYASVPSIALFGLNEMGVRFPSAFFGLVAVVALFGIARELFTSAGMKKKDIDLRASFVALLFAVSPWHINFSRQSFEANGSLTFFMLGVLFLLRFHKNARNLILAACFFAVSLYFYYSVRLVIPFVLLAFTIVEFQQIRRQIKTVALAAITGLVLISPLLPLMFSQGGLLRVQIVSVVNDPAYAKRKEQFTITAAQATNPVVRLAHNRRVALGITIVENYFKNLSPTFIFFNGSGSLGLQHLIEIPFFFLGIAALFLLKTPLRFILLAWMLAAPLPGALSTNQPNSLRTLLNAPVFSMLSALGALLLYDKLPRRKGILTAARAGFALLLLYALFIFSYSYFYWAPKTKSIVFADGHKQLAAYVQSVAGSFDTIHITGHYWRPYIFMLFWTGYDPATYQKKGSRDGFGLYRFTAAEWDTGGLYMGSREFSWKDLGIQNPKRELVVLSGPEYALHKGQFVKKVHYINGRNRKGMFVAATVFVPPY